MDYLVTDPARLAALRSLENDRTHLLEESTEVVRRTFVDTFDWAVYLADATLEWRPAGPRPTLIWQGLGPDADTLVQPAPAPPGLPVDLPPGPVRTRLLSLSPLRRLLPVMQIETRTRTLSLRNEDDKTVARLAVEESSYRDPRGGLPGDLNPRLRILPVRGYEDAAATTLETLHDALGITPVLEPPLVEALTASGRQPADYSPKLDYRLDPAERADAVTKTVLRGLFATLEANLAGARANLDSEFLHDLRVATRRIRSALSQIRGVFPPPLTAHFKAEFAWLQQVTGPVRDLDVYLLDFDAYQQALPPTLGPHLEPLRNFLLAHYAAEQQRLAEALSGDRFTRLAADWRAFLEAPVPDPGAPPGGADPIKDLADQRLRALVKRVRRDGRRVRADSPPEDLHALRKRCKKLRYLLEFFQSLYPKEPIRALIGVMKTLLDTLGGFQDLAVQAAHLRDLAQRLRDEDGAETDTLLAMGALIGQLLTRRQEARAEFDQVFSDFVHATHQQACRALFHPDPPDDQTL